MRKYTYRFSKYGEMRDRIKAKEAEDKQEEKRKPIYKLRAADEVIYK